eukprot:CAMPEP_0171325830 /NCGR_PEP_ID=MMETSP0816-20121228/117060_1 /TAXON_ID=420281 /ORGANISM="Proboscia inermis, Strain CCAP1064/1" /LENGTH=396 /DNA_ID=CAMNT_0011825119 /DNA_START=716 /DNA_END=1906 /DNA_ORIENTATION=-
MKFCKNLQRVVDISDPEWAPYWTNYKMLKKLIKELPSLVPPDFSGTTLKVRNNSFSSDDVDSDDADFNKKSLTFSSRGKSASMGHSGISSPLPTPTAKSNNSMMNSPTTRSKNALSTVATNISDTSNTATKQYQSQVSVGKLHKSPGEVAFFKLLHGELKKAIRFFSKAEEEFAIREERVRESMIIMKKPNSIMLINDRWSVLAKSVYRLYKDLLLLETFAIMSYCAYSKILKKHDKVTGYETRVAFMSNVVNKANFTNYPNLVQMISRTETLYDEVSHLLESEGKQGLYEDERLFLNMIHRLNEQALDTAGEEGAPDVTVRKEKKGLRPPMRCDGMGNEAALGDMNKSKASSNVVSENDVTAELRILVEENLNRKVNPVTEVSERIQTKRARTLR